MAKPKFLVTFEGYRNLGKECSTKRKAHQYIEHICDLFGYWMSDYAVITTK